jgi:hypothetical protein
MFMGPRILELADANEDGKLSADEASKAAGKFVKGKTAGLDAQELAAAINEQLGPPPGFGPGGDDGPPPPGDDGPGPGGPPRGQFGPGMFIAPQIIEAADTDKDGKLSVKEAETAAATFITENDADKKGSLDERTLADVMNRRIGPPPGMGGPGGPMGGQERKLVKQFDKDGDGRLNLKERTAAREQAKTDGPGMGGRRGFGPPPGLGGQNEPEVSEGPRVNPSDVPSYAGKPLYASDILRTLFLDFEEADWESALEDFHNTDVELPGTLTVDGKKYTGVGVHFRGMSSYGMVRAGHKRSLNISLDDVNPDQRLEGYKTLNLLNSHEDPTFLHTVLYFDIARNYIAAPKANFVRLVINGESWGVYVNAQQFDKILAAEHFSNGNGARWKVRGNPGADGGLRYSGDKVQDYKSRFEIKSKDDPNDWKALIDLCRTLNETPIDELEKALEPMLDLDGALWFLALDNALINGDGYWTRASDYSIYRDASGKFHLIPHDANETFGPAMMFGPGGPGRGGRRGPGAGGPGGGPSGGPGGRGGPANVDLDPLVGLDNDRTPLRSRLLKVPSLKARYLAHVKTIADEWLDWKKLGPIVAKYQDLIEPEIKADTRKLTSLADFERTVGGKAVEEAPRGRMAMSLRDFAEKRRAYLLANPDVQNAKP